MSVATEPARGEAAEEVEPPKQSRVKQFLQHAFVYGVGTISMQLVSIVLMPLYTNNFSQAEYGVLTTLYKIGDVLTICLMINGIRQASLNFWCSAENERQQAKIPATVALFTVCIIACGIALAFASSGILAGFLGLDDPLLLACGISAILLQASTVMPLALMQARLESTTYVITTLSILVVQLSLVIFGVLVLKWGVWGVVSALMATYAVFGIGLTIRELSHSEIKPDLQQFWKIAKFSAPFIPTGLCFFVLHSGDHFFLMKYYDEAAAGVYGLGYRLGKGVVMMAFQPLLQVWGAWMYEIAKQPEANAIFAQMYTRILTVCMWVGLTLLVFQKEVLAILSSAEFDESAQLLAPLVFAHFFLVLCQLMDSSYYVTRRTDLKPWLGLGATTFMLGCYYVLIPMYGGLGAAWATLAGFAFYAVLNALVAHTVFPTKIEVGRISALFLITLGIYALSTSLDVGFIGFTLKVLLTAAFPFVIWSLLANQQERHIVSDAMAKARAFLPVS